MNAELDARTALLALMPVVLMVMGWLVKRSIDVMDRSLDSLHKKLDSLGLKVDALKMKDAEHDASITELRVRVGHVEGEVASIRLWKEDMGGFLQNLGFRKREGGAG